MKNGIVTASKFVADQMKDSNNQDAVSFLFF